MAKDSPSPARLWAEQLALGLALLIAVLILMAFASPQLLARGGQVLTTGDLAAYGWLSALGVAVHLILHEGAALLAAKRLGLKPRFRPFILGANAAATLSPAPRRVWADAVVGLAGPVTGTALTALCALLYYGTGNPYFLGMGCVGAFYNLFTLIPILELEGGWIAPAIAPQAWFAGLILAVLELTHWFNLALLGVVAFGLPRLLLLLRARAPRVDTKLSESQRTALNLIYFVLVLGLAWFGTSSFEALARLVPEAMGD